MSLLIALETIRTVVLLCLAFVVVVMDAFYLSFADIFPFALPHKGSADLRSVPPSLRLGQSNTLDS